MNTWFEIGMALYAIVFLFCTFFICATLHEIFLVLEKLSDKIGGIETRTK